MEWGQGGMGGVGWGKGGIGGVGWGLNRMEWDQGGIRKGWGLNRMEF